MASLGVADDDSSLTLAFGRSAMPLHAMASLWALLGAIMTLAIPRGLEALVPERGSWNVDSATDLPTEPMDIQERKLVTQCCAFYTIERTVTTGMAEVLVAHVLQEHFNWTMQGIGLSFCLLNMSTGFVAMFSVSSHALTKRLPEFLKAMALLSAVGITLLLDLRTGVRGS